MAQALSRQPPEESALSKQTPTPEDSRGHGPGPPATALYILDHHLIKGPRSRSRTCRARQVRINACAGPTGARKTFFGALAERNNSRCDEVRGGGGSTRPGNGPPPGLTGARWGAKKSSAGKPPTNTSVGLTIPVRWIGCKFWSWAVVATIGLISAKPVVLSSRKLPIPLPQAATSPTVAAHQLLPRKLSSSHLTGIVSPTSVLSHRTAPKNPSGVVSGRIVLTGVRGCLAFTVSTVACTAFLASQL